MALSLPEASSTEPLPLDKVIAGLGDLFSDKYEVSLPTGLAETLRKLAENAKKNEEETREIMMFVNSEKKLSQTKIEVPAGVMQQEQTAHLVDIKVNVRGKPDDLVYSKHRDIREKIPRGMTVLQMKGKKDTVVIYGFKKFSGGIGDEDETQPETNDQWRDYCTENPDTAKEIVCISKLNGEAAHFSGRYIDGQFYLFVGSKNVHMMVFRPADIERYTGPRYKFAKVIAKEVFESVSRDRLDEHRQHLLFSLLHHTCCTVVGEILQPDSQHIVNLSHLPKPQLGFISFTPTVSAHMTTGASLTALPPHHSLDIAKALGLETAEYTIIDFKNFMQQRVKVRSKFEDEGEVWYLLNDQKNTIGLIKVKTAWYTILRALREKAVYCFTAAKKKSEWNLQDRIKSTHKRFSEIHNWLKFSEECLRQWKVLAEEYLRWLEVEIKQGRIDPKNIRPKFPVIWKKYLDDTNRTDKISFSAS